MSRVPASNQHRQSSRLGALLAALSLAALLVTPATAADPSARPTPSAKPRATPHTATPAFKPRGTGRAWDAQPDRAVDTAATRLIVTFKAGTSASQRRTIAARTNTKRVLDIPSERMSVVRTNAGASVRATMATLAADPTVARVSIDHQRFRDADPTAEDGWTYQWGMDNRGQAIYQDDPGSGGETDVDVDGAQALDLTTGDPSVVVAVIDDGVDFSHPDLVDRAWTNPGESGGGKETNGIDDDHDGYIDDVHGWDFCHDDNTVHDFDNDFHGTHVAGTIAASLNGFGVVGIAPSISIMALKFLSNNPNEGCGFDSQAIAAIAYAKSFGVKIANNSWGGRGSPNDAPDLYDAIADSGMLFVASAGNFGIDNDTDPLPSLPASFDLPNIISVAAIDNEGYIADFSDIGETSVDIAAPGVGILSSVPADSSYPDPGWTWLDGTSMAAPHVSGVAALVLSLHPELAASPEELKARLMGSGKPMPKTAGLTETGATVDALRALDVTPPDATAPICLGFVTNSLMSRTSVVARVRWPVGTDDLTGVSAYDVLYRLDEGAWRIQASATALRTTDRVVTFGRNYIFRVRARDGAGNWGAYIGGATDKATLYQESTSLATYTGHWATSSQAAWSGGKTRYTRNAGATVTFRFNGKSFGIVAPKGPTRGKVKIYLDGKFVVTVDLFRTKQLDRVVILARGWPASGAHTVKLVTVGGGSHPRVDIDGFLVMR